MTDLRPFLLRPDDTVRQAAARLRQNGLGFGAVVDGDNRLLGTLADSAVRRAALAGTDFDHPVTDVMSVKPLVAQAGADDGEILALLTSYRVRAIPVVDEDRLVAVRSLDEFPHRQAPAPTAPAASTGGPTMRCSRPGCSRRMAGSSAGRSRSARSRGSCGPRSRLERRSPSWTA